MQMKLIFLSAEDAAALASVLTEAAAGPNVQLELHAAIDGAGQPRVDAGAAKTANAKIVVAAESGVAGVWPDFTEAERRTVATCWEVLAFARPEIGDCQFERVRQQLAGVAVSDT